MNPCAPRLRSWQIASLHRQVISSVTLCQNRCLSAHPEMPCEIRWIVYPIGVSVLKSAYVYSKALLVRDAHDL
jgi:hypothetical protein